MSWVQPRANGKEDTVKIIYKEKVQDNTVVSVTKDTKFLSAQMQDGDLTIWFMLDLNEPRQHVWIRVYGTGHSIPDNPGEYIGSAQAGRFVWHVFAER